MLKKKNNIKNYIDQMKNLYIIILSYINSDNDEDLKKLLDFTDAQKINESKDDIREFFTLIVCICNNHQRNQLFIGKIEKILTLYLNIIKYNFSNLEIFNIFKRCKILLYFLYRNKIIAFDEEIEFQILNIFKNKQYYQYLKSENEEKSKIGENDSYLCELIRNDSIDEFIIYINQETIPLSSTITQSIFETNEFLIDKKTTIIEYSAFFGSIQIFQYLKINGIEMTPSLWLYAIHSNNAEMIQILEDNNVKPNDDTYFECLEESIKCHHNEIAHYIINNHLKKEKIEYYDKFDFNKYCKNIYTIGFKYHNCEFYPEFVCFIFMTYACEYDHLKLVKLLSNMKKLKKEYHLIYNYKLI